MTKIMTNVMFVIVGCIVIHKMVKEKTEKLNLTLNWI